MSASREVIVSKSLLRIVAVVAVAALIFGTVAAAVGSLAGADDGRHQQPTTVPTSKALGTELGLPATTVDAVTEGHLAQPQTDALLDAAADGSIGSTHAR